MSDRMLEAAFMEFMVLLNRTCIMQPQAFITTAVYHEKIVDIIAYLQEHLMENPDRKAEGAVPVIALNLLANVE